MCTICGCGSDTVQVEGRKSAVDDHWHQHADGSWHRHDPPGGEHRHQHAGPDRQAGYVASLLATRNSRPAAPPASRVVEVEQALLAKNDAIAAQNRKLLADRGIFALNLVSSPGAGKTSLLVRTIEAWKDSAPIAVIEGDQQTSRDADRVRAAGARAVQINTGKGCHLDARMVASALDQLSPAEASLLLIENVGNLVCPAAFDLGEAHKVAILSVTEGEDKPLKYPDMFRAADLVVLSKIDLLPYVDFDPETALDYARRVRPGIEVIRLSSKTGEGFDAWLAWLDRGVAQASGRLEDTVAALQGRILALENELARRTTPS
jgi:hydrogenase nickel incorporation protein HypB